MSRTGVEPKPPWRNLPPALRHAVGEALGAPVRRAERVYGGYGPAPTFRLLLRDDRRAFFKGVGPNDNPFATAALAREAGYYRDLAPLLAGWAPDRLGEVRLDGWHALLLEDLGPKSVPPWSDAAARGVMQAFAAFHRATLDHPLLARLPPPGTYAGGFAGAWQRILASEELRQTAMLAGPRANEAHDWLQTHAGRLSALALRLAEAPPPFVLLHGDLRSDNLRWRGGRLRMFDWPHLGAGPAEFDAVATAQSMTVEGGPEPERLLGWYETRELLRSAVVDAAVAAVAGFMAELAWQPELPGLPRLRAFQRAQLRVTLRWAAVRLGLPEPAWLDAVPV